MWPTLDSTRFRRSYPERSPSARTPSATASVVVSSIVRIGVVRTGLSDDHQPEKLGEHRDRAALGFEDRLGDVSQILAVRLQRQRVVAAYGNSVEIVAAECVARGPPGREREQEGRERPRGQ